MRFHFGKSRISITESLKENDRSDKDFRKLRGFFRFKGPDHLLPIINFIEKIKSMYVYLLDLINFFNNFDYRPSSIGYIGSMTLKI